MAERRRNRVHVDAKSEATALGTGDLFMKTKLCKFQLLGMCTKGGLCPFAHEASEMKPLPDLSRTKLCKTLLHTGTCQNQGCTFAHDKGELRVVTSRRKGGRVRDPMRRTPGAIPCQGVTPRRRQVVDANEASSRWPPESGVCKTPAAGMVKMVAHALPQPPDWESHGLRHGYRQDLISLQIPDANRLHSNVVVIQTPCPNDGHDDRCQVIGASTILTELLESGDVTVKNSFLDFEPRPQLRMVRSASGRLDLSQHVTLIEGH